MKLEEVLNWTTTTIACVAMAFVSCCTNPPRPDVKRACVSYCGMLFQDEPNGSMSCSQLQTAEDKTLDAFDENLCKEDPRFCRKAACKSLFGWQITAEDNVVGTENGSAFYLGESECRTKTMLLCRNSDWRHGSFPHELAHVVQDCKPLASWQETEREQSLGGGHAGWTEHNVYGTIDQIRHGSD